MKKIIALILSALIAPAILSGCTGGAAKRTDDISNVCERFEEDFKRLCSKEYDNLIFMDTTYTAPKADYVCELTMTPLMGKTTDEIYDFFSKTVDILTDKKYTDEEKRYEIRFVDAANSYTDDSGKSYPYSCPDVDKYKEGYETDYPWPTIDSKDYFIDMMFGVLRGYDNGSLAKFDKKEQSYLFNYFMINGSHYPVFFTEDLTCTDTYRLVNGEISIADAAKFAQNYLDNLKISPYEGNIPKPRVAAVNVINIGEGCFGYNFVTTCEYKGINFDYRFSRGKGAGSTLRETDYDSRSYYSSKGDIDMIETNRISRFLNIADGYEIIEGEPQTTVITLETAADMISEFLSGAMDLYVQNVSMVWLPEKTENEITDLATHPCWKFKLIHGGETYHTFVNMITGEIYLYVQVG